MSSKLAERIPPPDLKSHTDATSGTESVTLRLVCLVTGDAAQAELTAWKDQPMVNPDRQGPHRGETEKLPPPPFPSAIFFLFPYCKISVIIAVSLSTIYLTI